MKVEKQTIFDRLHVWLYMNDRTSWFYNPIRWKVGWVMERPREIKWFWQRGRRGYADCDVWGIDEYLCEWMPQAIRQLRERRRGYPISISGKQWNDALIKIEKGFVAHRKLGSLDFMRTRSGKELPTNRWKVKQKRLYLEEKEGLKLFIKWFSYLWD